MVKQIETSRNIRTTLDMLPVTTWLDKNVVDNNWSWVVSDTYIPGWGHPMIVEFENPVTPEFLTLFRLMFG